MPRLPTHGPRSVLLAAASAGEVVLHPAFRADVVQRLVAADAVQEAALARARQVGGGGRGHAGNVALPSDADDGPDPGVRFLSGGTHVTRRLDRDPVGRRIGACP